MATAGEPPSAAAVAATASGAAAAADGSESAAEVRRFAKADIEDLLKNKYKTVFLKEKCAECGKPATKRFANTMSVVVTAMTDSFWCNECGRILCDSHRHQHTCERLDQQKERNKHLTAAQLAVQMEEAERLKNQAEEEKNSSARAAALAADRERVIRKEKRLVLAKKAKMVEDFLQGYTRDTDATARLGPRVRDELFEMYSRAKRIALTLYNEYEHPSGPELAEEEWSDVKEIYERARELTGFFLRDPDTGGPLQMRNPWDPPPPNQEDGTIPDADGGGLGRGLL